jgi:hypothetical protein
MSKQIPHGPDHLYCPWWKQKMAKVCHTCPMWTQLRGRNPNTGEEVDQWNCSLATLPMLLVENAQQARAAGAATESFRNEVVKRAEESKAQQSTAYAGQIAHHVSAPEIVMIPFKGN